MRSLIFAILLAAVDVQARSTGVLSLYADTDCTLNPYVNNGTVGADVCLKPTELGALTDATLTSNAFQSYVINSRPICSNGTQATLTLYSDDDCADTSGVQQPLPLLHSLGTSDGGCEKSGKFQTLAFICNGFEDPDPGYANIDRGGSNSGTEDEGTPLVVSTLASDSDTVPTRMPIPVGALSSASAADATASASADAATDIVTRSSAFPTPNIPIPTSALSAVSHSEASLSTTSTPSLAVTTSTAAQASPTAAATASTTQSPASAGTATSSPAATTAGASSSSSQRNPARGGFVVVVCMFATWFG